MMIVQTQDVTRGVEAADGLTSLVHHLCVAIYPEPAVTGYALDGDSSTRRVQYYVGGVLPRVDLPSGRVGSYAISSRTGALNSSTGLSTKAGSRRKFSARDLGQTWSA